MSCNYRVMIHRHIDSDDAYAIHEVYYDDDNGNPYGWTENPSSPFGETIEELRVNLKMMLAALDNSVLEYK